MGKKIMAEILHVSCPGCEAVFELPANLGGELGECTECCAIFEIPMTETARQMKKTDTGTIQVKKAEASEGTNTVKLSRASIGMVPDIKDSFKFDVVDAAPATSSTPASSSNSMTKSKTLSKKRTTTRTRTSQRKSTPPPKPKKKWWQFWK